MTGENARVSPLVFVIYSGKIVVIYVRHAVKYISAPYFSCYK